MANLDEKIISRVVSEVLARLASQTKAAPSSTSSFGVYEKMEDACEAAHRSFEKLRDLGVSARRKAINVIRKMVVAKAKSSSSCRAAPRGSRPMTRRPRWTPS